MDSRELHALQILLAVEAEGGFAAAARRLGVTRAAVSRAIGELEARLGVRLARRTTRKVVLTDAAAALVKRCAGPLRTVGEALDATRELSAGLAGTVRVAGPAAFGRDVLLPALLGFRGAHPEVAIDLVLADQVEDLVARPIDVAVRLGPLEETSLIARAVGALPLALVAPAKLAAARRAPRAIDELDGWPAIQFRLPRTGARYAWPFEVRGELRLHEPKQVVFETDSIDAVAELARRGAGIAMVPRHLVEADLRAGRLVPLLEGQVAAGPPVSVCHAQRAHMPKRVRALIEWLTGALPKGLDQARPRRRRTAS
ncbi:MAG: LysR family transcriptional regulator [Byssovorax sp.]